MNVSSPDAVVLVGHCRLRDGLVRVHVERAVELVAHHLLLHAAHVDLSAVRASHRLKGMEKILLIS